MKFANFGCYRAMKTSTFYMAVFTSLIFLFSFKSGEPHGKAKLPLIRKELKIKGDFQHITVDGNLSVILTNDPAGTVVIEGKEKDLNRIRHILKNNTLTINANRNVLLFSKLTIYLSALQLQDLQVNGDSNIASTGVLKSGDLHLSLNGNIGVKVKTLGKVSVDSPENIELHWTSPKIRN